MARLETRAKMLNALNCNPNRIQTDFQRALDAYIAGKAAPLSEQTYPELCLTLQMTEWFAGLFSDAPALPEVRQALAKRSVLASFEHLC